MRFILKRNTITPRLERSSFCGAKRNKKAGVEDGKRRHKK